MYIEFRLPTGAGGMAAACAVTILRSQIAKWADVHDIPYKTKIHKYTFRLCLESDADYTLFQLSWTNRMIEYAIVHPQS